MRGEDRQAADLIPSKRKKPIFFHFRLKVGAAVLDKAMLIGILDILSVQWNWDLTKSNFESSAPHVSHGAHNCSSGMGAKNFAQNAATYHANSTVIGISRVV